MDKWVEWEGKYQYRVSVLSRVKHSTRTSKTYFTSLREDFTATAGDQQVLLCLFAVPVSCLSHLI